MASQTLIMIIAIAILIALAAIGLGLFVFLRQKPAGTETATLELSNCAASFPSLPNSRSSNSKVMSNRWPLFQKAGRSLAGMSARMGNSLQEQTEKTHKNLSDLAARLAVIDAANAKIGELTGQVTQLHNILANKTDRGAFGEVQLENLVRNVLPPNAYEFQVQLSNGRRADCLLKLPNPPGDIIIDAKFPLESWHQMQNAKDENGRKAARKQLGMDVLKHVKDIQERYIITGETARSACLFLPSEAVYAELHANMLDVVEKSYDARVWIVSLQP